MVSTNSLKIPDTRFYPDKSYNVDEKGERTEVHYKENKPVRVQLKNSKEAMSLDVANIRSPIPEISRVYLYFDAVQKII